MSNVKNYRDEEILERVKSLSNYGRIPRGYWMCFIRSNEDAYNKFDDKCYLWKGETFLNVTSCTTNSGAYGLKNFKKWNKKGVAVLKSNMWYYDAWERGKHKGRMEAWRQTGAKVAVHRDGDMDRKTEELGKESWGYFGINIHTVSYKLVDIVKKYIGGWSVGCMVLNATKVYRNYLRKVDKAGQKGMTICLLKEF